MIQVNRGLFGQKLEKKSKFFSCFYVFSKKIRFLSPKRRFGTFLEHLTVRSDDTELPIIRQRLFNRTGPFLVVKDCHLEKLRFEKDSLFRIRQGKVCRGLSTFENKQNGMELFFSPGTGL